MGQSLSSGGHGWTRPLGCGLGWVHTGRPASGCLFSELSLPPSWLLSSFCWISSSRSFLWKSAQDFLETCASMSLWLDSWQFGLLGILDTRSFHLRRYPSIGFRLLIHLLLARFSSSLAELIMMTYFHFLFGDFLCHLFLLNTPQFPRLCPDGGCVGVSLKAVLQSFLFLLPYLLWITITFLILSLA